MITSLSGIEFCSCAKTVVGIRSVSVAATVVSVAATVVSVAATVVGTNLLLIGVFGKDSSMSLVQDVDCLQCLT